MKILLEEIVRSHPAKSPITYRRQLGIIYDLPDVLFSELSAGDRLRDVGDRRNLRVLRTRLALLDHIADVSACVGLTVDVCTEEAYEEINRGIKDACARTPNAYEAYEDWLSRHEVPA